MGSSDDKVFCHESVVIKFIHFCRDLVVNPVIWFREKVVLPNRKEYYWYHEKIRRVPTIDECYTDDTVCMFEADRQYELDRNVDKNIVRILRKRYKYCQFENSEETEVCNHLLDIYKRAATNYFIKYGDLGINNSALGCYMKQKNRMAWERRHGPIGSTEKVEYENL